MTQKWEYKVQAFPFMDHPFYQFNFPAPDIGKELEKLGQEGWELVHVREVEGRWRSSPENYPGGDPGRQVWDHGSSVFYFKRRVILEVASSVQR